MARPPATGHGLAVSTDFTLYRSKERILAVVEKRLRERAAKGFRVGHLNLMAPPESELHQAIWSGSSCYVAVPADAARKPGIVKMTQSKNALARAQGAKFLGQYPGDETTKLLRTLLGDDGTEVLTTMSAGKTTRVTVYPVRQAAYDSLRLLRIDVSKPEGYREQYSSGHF
ncbi:MAG: hypothetical protein N2C14_06605 [Planctomycetales bacterium]